MEYAFSYTANFCSWCKFQILKRVRDSAIKWMADSIIKMNGLESEYMQGGSYSLNGTKIEKHVFSIFCFIFVLFFQKHLERIYTLFFMPNEFHSIHCFWLFVWTWSYIAQAGLELVKSWGWVWSTEIHLPLPPKGWN